MLPPGRLVPVIAVCLPVLLAGGVAIARSDGETGAAPAVTTAELALVRDVSRAPLLDITPRAGSAVKELYPREALVPARPAPYESPAPRSVRPPQPAPGPRVSIAESLGPLARSVAEPGQAAVSTAKIAVGTEDPAEPAGTEHFLARPVQENAPSPRTGIALATLLAGLLLVLVTGVALRRAACSTAATG